MTAHSFYTRNLDPEDLTRQIIEQHNQILLLEKFFQKYVPGFERARLTGIANMHGIRDSRRILGEYILKDTDVASGTKFADGIARFPEFFDTHHPTSPRIGFMRHIHVPAPLEGAVCREAQCSDDMHIFGRPAGLEARVDPRNHCEIPYRTLAPLNVDNLLVVGRCISSEFNAQAAVRIIAVLSTGQAAGTAAAICLERDYPQRSGRKIGPAENDRRRGSLDQELTGHWAKVKAFEGDFVVLAGDFIGIKQADGRLLRHVTRKGVGFMIDYGIAGKIALVTGAGKV